MDGGNDNLVKRTALDIFFGGLLLAMAALAGLVAAAVVAGPAAVIFGIIAAVWGKDEDYWLTAVLWSGIVAAALTVLALVGSLRRGLPRSGKGA